MVLNETEKKKEPEKIELEKFNEEFEKNIILLNQTYIAYKV